MATVNNPSPLHSPTLKPKSLLAKPLCIISPTYPRFLRRANTSLPKPLLSKCSSSNSNSNSNSSRDSETSNNLKDALSGMVDKQVEDLLNREDNRALFDGLEKASQRVERAKRELAEIERQELEAKQLRNYINQLESRASEIAECQQEILEAKIKVEEAEQFRSESIGREEGTNIEQERLESIKAASISAVVGTLAGLPFFFTQVTDTVQLALPFATTFISCALFGVTFRYAVRRDLENFQLKSGTCAAFGFVKGLGTLAGGSPLELNPASLLSRGFDGGVYVSENLLIFAFAAVSLDLCFKMGLLSPFPMQQQNS